MWRRAYPAIVALALLAILGCKERDAGKSDPGAGPRVESQATASKTTAFSLSEKEKQILLDIARKTLVLWVRDRKVPEFDVPEGTLREIGAAFVTFRKHGRLRGCIGHIIAREPLWKCVREMAVSASTYDRRFAPIRPDELREISVEVSVLTPPEPVGSPSDIKLGRDGVIVRKGMKSGVYLPQVATETGWDRKTLLANLCSHKAGLRPNCYNDPEVTLLRFEAIVFE